MLNIFISQELKKRAKLIGCTYKKASALEKLSIQSAAAMTKINQKSLKYNKLCICDTFIFTVFLIRFFCIVSIDSRSNAIKFSEQYIHLANKCYYEKENLPNEIRNDIFSNRLKLYDSIFAESENLDDNFENLFFEFTSIILNDISGNYIPVHSDSPLTLHGLHMQSSVYNEVIEYYKTFPTFFKSYMDEAITECNTHKTEEIPTLDIDSLCFATDEEVEKAKQDYAREMYEYIKRKEKR